MRREVSKVNIVMTITSPTAKQEVEFKDALINENNRRILSAANHLRIYLKFTTKEIAGFNKGSTENSVFQSSIGRFLVGFDWVNAVFRSLS
ncbi:unnamed protein product [Lactuca virosa]|uniref:Uncharacterized protein n=1 Tax=Lactuca virosa TaxID=75947 RepID=A0AAU9MN75_9ASTR|nr:unnamed protein product [Lactuca virosa]